jgi:hypothetical protein
MAWTVSALILIAESVRNAGYDGWGNLLDIGRLALYWWWMRMAWKCSGNVDRGFWTLLARIALALGLVVNVLA